MRLRAGLGSGGDCSALLGRCSPAGRTRLFGLPRRGPQPPALPNRVPEEIVVALDAFRAGTKPATVMDRIAKGFSHDESVAIAVWVAAPK